MFLLILFIYDSAAFPLLSPLGRWHLQPADIVSAPASQAYVERVFSVCGDLTAGKLLPARRLRFSSDADIVRLTNARIIIIIIKRNRLTKTLEMRVVGKVNMKYYS